MSHALRSPLERALSEGVPIGAIELYLEICDIVNETEDGHIEAMKIIRKKITSKPTPPILLRILSVLEVFVNNCHRRFRVLVASPDFVAILTAFVDQPGQATVVRNKILFLLQEWAELFSGSPELAAVANAVATLRQRGVEFPSHNPSLRNSPETSDPPGARQAARRDVPTRIVELQPNQRIHADEGQIARLHHDLAIARAHATRLASGPDQSLHAVCTLMRDRAVTLTNHIANEDLLGEVLQVIDVLNTALSPASTLQPLTSEAPRVSAAPYVPVMAAASLQAHPALYVNPFFPAPHAQPAHTTTAATTTTATPAAAAAAAASGLGGHLSPQPDTHAPTHAPSYHPSAAPSQGPLVNFGDDLSGATDTDDVVLSASQPPPPPLAPAASAPPLHSGPSAWAVSSNTTPPASVFSDTTNGSAAGPDSTVAPAYAPPPALRRPAAPAAATASRDKMEAEHDELFAL